MPYDKNLKQRLLENISQIESSGGKDLKHKEIQHGIHEGTRAMGKYGLLPNTVKELINRRRLTGQLTPDMQELNEMSPEEMKSKIEANPDLEDQLAQQLASHVVERQLGDEEKAAYSWNSGHNLNPQDITPEKLNKSEYVQKYRKLKTMMNGEE